MSKIKVAFAQIEFKPCFYYNQIDMMVEPYGDDSTSISEFNFAGSQKLKNNLKENYISWFKLKILAILNKAINLGVNLLVFPEYSIPVAILDDMVKAMQKTKLVVVAGTHIVTNIKHVFPPNYPDTKGINGCAMCPILTSEGVIGHTLKTHKAAPEINSIRVPKNPVNNIFDMGDYVIQVKICIDAITVGSSLSFNKYNKGILVVPSWSKNTEPFQALATISRFNEVPVIYANCADVGGSVISGAFSRYYDHWFAEKNITKAVPKKSECMVTATIDIDRMYNAIGTVHTTAAISVEEVVNIFYRQDELQNKTMHSIDTYLDNFESSVIDSTINTCADLVLADKIRFLKKVENNGLLEKDIAENTLEYIKVNSISLDQLMYEQSSQAFNAIAANIQHAASEEKLFENMGKLSNYLADTNNSTLSNQGNLFEDDNLFSGRDDEIAMLSNFFNSDKSVLLLHGLRGIGKTKLAKKISTRVLPSPSPWEIKFIELEKGIGYELLFDQLSYTLNLTYIEQKGVAVDNIVKKMFEYIEQNAPVALIIDDIHNCTEVNGIFADKKMKEFILSFILHSLSSKKIKLILISNRRIADIEKLGIASEGISRLDNNDVRFVISYCYRKITNSTKSLEIKDSIIDRIYGNPLAAILVAQLIEEDKLQEFENKGELFRRFQDRLIKNLLGEVKLSDDETTLMNLLSATKTAIEIDFIEKNYGYLMPAVSSLSNRFLLEKSDLFVKIHPLFKEYYYDFLDIKDRTDYHKVFATYYENLLDTKKTDKKQTNPIILSNVIYHYAGSLQLNKVRQYKTRYIDEIKPIADRLYKDKNFEEAVRYYHMIFETIGEQRTDIFIRMAQCYAYGNDNDINNAEKFFRLAVAANPRGAYLWAQFATALSSRKKYISKASEYAYEAESIYYKYGNTFDWELAKIKFAQARVCRFENRVKALQLYDEACSLDKTNLYYLCTYAKYLYDSGDKPNAYEKYKLAEDIDSEYGFLKKLKYISEEQSEILKENDLEEDEIEPEDDNLL